MTSQTELAADLVLLKDTVTKIGGETRSLLTRITELLEAMANGPISPEVETALAALKAQVEVVDGLVPDLETPPAP